MLLSRRRFIQFSATGAAAVVAHRAAAANTRAQPVRPLGFSLYGMRSLPLATAIDHCARIGYNHVELCVLKDFPSELGKFSASARREVRERLRSTGLEAASLLIQINLTDANQQPALDTIKAAGEVARDLGTPRMPLLETITGGKSTDWDKLKDKLAANMRAWAETAAAAGTRIAVKAHYGQIINTPDRLLWLHRTVKHPAFTLTYDYSHYQAEGLELEPTLREVIPHTSFIHVKDLVVGERPAKYLLVGEGKIDYVKYFKLLRELNYTGPVIVEVSAQIHRQPGYDPVATAEKCYATLARARQSTLG